MHHFQDFDFPSAWSCPQLFSIMVCGLIQTCGSIVHVNSRALEQYLDVNLQIKAFPDRLVFSVIQEYPFIASNLLFGLLQDYMEILVQFGRLETPQVGFCHSVPFSVGSLILYRIRLRINCFPIRLCDCLYLYIFYVLV